MGWTYTSVYIFGLPAVMVFSILTILIRNNAFHGGLGPILLTEGLYGGYHSWVVVDRLRCKALH